jgi:peptidoglycan DL-endopeptidase CwlO
MHTRLVTKLSKAKRGVVVGVAVLMAGGLAVTMAQRAGAQPQPTITQVQAKVNALTSKFNKAVQQYDQVAEQLSAAKARLDQVNKEMGTAQSKYDTARRQVVQIADAQYEDSGSTSLAGLLTSNDPAQVLAEASMVQQITGARNMQTQAFLDDAQELTSVQSEQKRTEFGIAQLAKQRENTRNSISKLLTTEKSTLATLTAAQQQQVQQHSVGGGGGTSGGSGGGTSKPPYTGPTGSQADKAVQFVYDQLGCPYVFGATGPCNDGFDCSGLVMSAWAYAGITIPRDTYEQWAALPHISLSSIQPGDLLYYNGIGHVAMYVGNGYIIDAPQPGMNVERIPMNESWYVDNFDGAARP